MSEVRVEVGDVISAYFLSLNFDPVDVYVYEGRTWVVSVPTENLSHTLRRVRRWAKEEQLDCVTVHVDGEPRTVVPAARSAA